MKLEVIVFGVMRAVMINCKSTLSGLDSYRFSYIHRAHDQIMPLKRLMYPAGLRFKPMHQNEGA